MPSVNPYFDQNLGAYTNALAGAAQLYDMYDNMNQGTGFRANAPQSYDPAYRPQYGLGQQYNQALSINPQGASGGEILSGAGTGAVAGSSFGPVGTAVGAVVGGLVSIVGGAGRKSKQKAEKSQALKTLQGGQEAYNTATENYLKQQNTMEDYYDTRQGRMANLYRIPTTYESMF